METPNFSGVWELNLEKSHLKRLIPQRIAVRIEHSANSIRQQRASLTFSPIGNATSVRSRGNSGETRARWEGSALIVKSALAVSGRELHFRDYWSLLWDGGVLTMAHLDDELAGQISVLERAPSQSFERLLDETNL